MVPQANQIAHYAIKRRLISLLLVLLTIITCAVMCKTLWPRTLSRQIKQYGIERPVDLSGEWDVYGINW